MDFSLSEDTICAIATPAGDGGIGIVRISGENSLPIVLQLFKPRRSRHAFQSHRLYYGQIIDPSTSEPVDEVLLSFMAGPHSYTREDVAEINCHSGQAVLTRILKLVLSAGARLAEPGEFTRRAFLNGRIDLSQAEAVIDVIRSRSQESLRLANFHLQGILRNQVETWRQNILQLQAEIEAHIDFADDMEEEPSDSHTLLRLLRNTLMAPLEETLGSYAQGKIFREGLTVVLVGKPNVGKSSLLNALIGRDRAIVTPLPGTTRDVVEDSFLLSGIQVRILDTAGIRHHPDAIESLGIQRTLISIQEADFVLWLMDRSLPLSQEDDTVFRSIASKRAIALLNKSDLPASTSPREFKERYSNIDPVLEISVLSPTDIEGLKSVLAHAFLGQPLNNSQSMVLANLRHKECLDRAWESLSRAAELLVIKEAFELVSYELHSARQQMESLLGLERDDALLDRIFSQFCIGK